MRVFVSIGHDAVRTGSRNSEYDITEYDICVDLTQYLYEELIELKIDAEKVWSDKLGEAISEINGKARLNDIAIETHINSFSNPSVRGCETLYYTNSGRGKKLAQDIQNSLLAHLGVKDRGILERDNLTFLKKIKCTSIITEPFFLSNEDEVKRFLLKDREDNLRNIAFSIAMGVKSYINRKR